MEQQGSDQLIIFRVVRGGPGQEVEVGYVWRKVISADRRRAQGQAGKLWHYQVVMQGHYQDAS